MDQEGPSWNIFVFHRKSYVNFYVVKFNIGPYGNHWGVKVMVFNATFNNISVICGGKLCCWRKPEYPEKTTDLRQVTDKL